MASPLPTFVIASELPLSPAEREALESRIREQAAQLEKLQDGGYGGNILPGEIRKFVEIISVLEGRIKALELQTEKQAAQIKDLRTESNAIGQEVYDVHEMAKTIISDACKRITALEESDTSDSATAQAHVEELYKHMEMIGRKQVSFKEASRCLKLSKSRVLQLKAALALDDRFIIVPSETHKQKKLIRLRKYYVGVDAHKTA